MKILVLLVIIMTLTACHPTFPNHCTAESVLTVYAAIPRADYAPEVVDTLEMGEATINTAVVEGWYETTTPRLVSGYIDSGLCEVEP
jgi:hypothetical protein